MGHPVNQKKCSIQLAVNIIYTARHEKYHTH
jgi:hypothetical protein